ncbi:ATP-binding cassette domain-containing protein [Spiroplasma endosymbiont of Phyllotreta cruciferae]|uniref:ATP-binding cassette domain-containing protein n=1 Tax=Spiroplasma endosymbiont of Phyllotreta cruciferae TaxID=2886375 RepID=UPI0020A19409|nr:ATP-binding cassette domain-containing protein [Spiroplasma endosymbiont of Phyllotreta cruciferae]
MHAILGASGSGKTVFIKSLIGGLKGFKGDIYIFGKKATKVGMKKIIGYVPEFITFPENISSYNFFKIYGENKWFTRKIFTWANWILNEVLRNLRTPW